MSEERAVLAVDVGGSHVKMLLSGHSESRREITGLAFTASHMVEAVHRASAGWTWDAVTVGIPAPVYLGRVVTEPFNLGAGWVGFDYEAAFGVPTRVMNDAAMQALGSYDGSGTMLFLGLGTGLGSAIVSDWDVQPMELAHLRFRSRTFEDYLGERGRRRLGAARWQRRVAEAVEHLTGALEPDSVVLGGGNATKLDQLPPRARLGANSNAFTGGFRVWESAESLRAAATDARAE